MVMPHVLVFAAKAPPSSSVASAQVLERLTSGAEEHFGYVHQVDGLPRSEAASAYFPVKNDFETLSRQPLLWRFEQFGWYRAAVREGLKQVNNSKWDVILACHPSMSFSLAAAKVARSKGSPLVVYLMDLFAESRVNRIEKFWAEATEKKLLMQASAVVCLTEGIQKHYTDKYRISPILIPHCVTEAEISDALANKPDMTVGSPLIITYAGGVYQARLDSLVAVKQAIEQLNIAGYPVHLHILGRNDPVQLAAWGIGGPYVSVRFIQDRGEFMDQLRRSDILLSTIAFKSSYPLQDQTSFPTKTFDYFLAGKPILVIAPNDSNYASYMRMHLCALTIDSQKVDRIARAIRKFAFDLSYRTKLVASGVLRVQEHCLTRIQPLFLNTLAEACSL